MLSRIRRRLRYLYFIRLFCYPSPGDYFLQRCTCNLLATNLQEVIINISTFVQCCAYSVGQAAQPIISTNYGAGKGGRIRETLKYALGTTAFFAIFWTVISLAVPNGYIKVFMSPTAEILKIARGMILSGLFIFLLPMCFGAGSLWFAMPLTELVIAVYVVYHMWKYTCALPK